MLTLKNGLCLFAEFLVFLSAASCTEQQGIDVSVGHTAVIVVDVQKDFIEGGSLAVPNSGQDYIEEVDIATRRLKSRGFKILATQDWHPEDHISFYTNRDVSSITADTQAKPQPSEPERLQTLWPPHCVQYTEGAAILLSTNGENKVVDAIIQKGANPKYDSYSGFQDDGGTETPLNEMLKLAGVKKVLIYGIATDYCVKATVMDALKRGYETALITSLCRGVRLDSTTLALHEMERAGAAIHTTLDDFLAGLR